MYNIGIIGDRASVLGFMALGFSVYEAKTAQAAGKILLELAKSEKYAILFIVEKYASEIEETIAIFKNVPVPAVVVIPGKDGNTGYGMAGIKSAVERAVGADILFKE